MQIFRASCMLSSLIWPNAPCLSLSVAKHIRLHGPNRLSLHKSLSMGHICLSQHKSSSIAHIYLSWYKAPFMAHISLPWWISAFTTYSSLSWHVLGIKQWKHINHCLFDNGKASLHKYMYFRNVPNSVGRNQIPYTSMPICCRNNGTDFQIIPTIV